MAVDLSGVDFQIVGLETEAPVLRLGDKHYEGTWREYVGTGILFDENQNVAALCEKRLTFKRVLPLHLEETEKNRPIHKTEVQMEPVVAPRYDPLFRIYCSACIR